MCPPLAFGAGGGHTRWVETGWGVNSSEDARHCSVLYICKYFVDGDIGIWGPGNILLAGDDRFRRVAGDPGQGLEDRPVRRPAQLS